MKWQLLLIILICILSSSYIYAADPTLQDCSGNGLNLTNINATYNSSTNMYNFRAMNSTDRRTLYVNSTKLLFNNTNFSISMWVLLGSNTTAVDGGDTQILLSTMTASSKYNYRIDFINSTKRIEYMIGNATNTDNSFITNPNLTTHLTFVFMSYNGSIITYCVDATCGTYNPTANVKMQSISNMFYIGSQNNAFNTNGSIGEVRVYNASLNTTNAADIRLNKTVRTDALVARYRFINSSDCTYADTPTCNYSGSGNWNIDANDNCTITTNYVVTGNISIYNNIGITNFYSNIRCQGFSKANSSVVIAPGQYGKLLSLKMTPELDNNTFVYDTSLFRNNGIVVNATFINNSYLMNSNNLSKITVLNTAQLNNTPTGLSFGGWINVQDFHQFSVFMSKGKTAEAPPYTGSWSMYSDSGPVMACVVSSNTTNQYYTSCAIPATGTWQHYVCTYNNSLIAIYKNGTLCGSNPTNTFNMVNNSANLTIGYDQLRPTDARMYLNGSVKGNFITNYSMNATEVSQEYQFGSNKIFYIGQ